MAPGRVITCVARVSVDEGAQASARIPPPPPLRALSTSPLLEQAAELLGRGSLDAVVYASTSSAFAIGFDAEAAVVSRLSPRVRLPVLATCASTVLALRTLGSRARCARPPAMVRRRAERPRSGLFREHGIRRGLVWVGCPLPGSSPDRRRCRVRMDVPEREWRCRGGVHRRQRVPSRGSNRRAGG
jgi:hypothetical protein